MTAEDLKTYRTAEFYATAEDYERRVLGMNLRDWDQFYADFRRKELLQHYRDRAEWFRFVEETQRDFKIVRRSP